MASKEKSKYQHVEHGFGPCFDAESRVLILGSFPSVKSREVSFYYGHPMNRFWPIMSEIFHREIGKNTDDKRAFLHDVHLAVYDVIESCDIIGSSDTSIKNPVTTDIFSILEDSRIELIILNGTKSGRLFEKYQLPRLGDKVPHLILPSTSPANAAIKFEALLEKWREALSFLLLS